MVDVVDDDDDDNWVCHAQQVVTRHLVDDSINEGDLDSLTMPFRVIVTLFVDWISFLPLVVVVVVAVQDDDVLIMSFEGHAIGVPYAPMLPLFWNLGIVPCIRHVSSHASLVGVGVGVGDDRYWWDVYMYNSRMMSLSLTHSLTTHSLAFLCWSRFEF